MFEMIRRVFKIAVNSRRKIVAGIVCNILKSFFNGFMMFGVFWILLHLDELSPVIIGQAFGVILGSVLGRFFFQWMYDRTMSGSGYDIFRDYRLEIGERLKQAPMGYFSEQNLGTIQAMLTTTIADLEGYSMLAIEQMTSGVAMAVLMSVMMFFFSPVIAGLSLVGLALGMLVLVVTVQRSIRIRLRRGRQQTARPNARGLAMWQETEQLSRLLRQPSPEALEALAQKAKFSQHTLTAEELTQFTAYLTDARHQLEQKPLYLRLVYMYLYAVI